MTDEELTAAIREVQDRVRSRVTQGSLGLDGVAATELMPLVHARDAAEAKVAAIGTVNPRPPGFKNAIIQRLKRSVARALDWHVREQVEFLIDDADTVALRVQRTGDRRGLAVDKNCRRIGLN